MLVVVVCVVAAAGAAAVGKWHFCCCYSIMRHGLFGSDASSEVPSFYGRPQRIRLYTHLRRVVPVLSMRDKG
jgi:hypothetical protein